jgi:hypothetical protein
VTASGLSYQPPSNLTEGQYAVKAVITNNMGTSSTTGVINFTLNVNAPDIATITPNKGSQHGGMVATVTGNRLLSTTGSAPAVAVGGNPAQVLSAVAGSPDQLTIMIPAGAPGAANVQAITDRGTGVRSGGFTYEADPRTPYTTEPDTVLLWHMDEPDNSTVQIKDSGATKALYGIFSYTSTATAGRFAGGRALTNIQAVSDFGSLYFGSNSFTAECWVKTNPVGMTYKLVGNEDFYGGYYGPPEFAVRLLPSGGLRVLVYDSLQRQWKAEVAPTTFVVDNNQWHYVAVSVDRTASQLYLYVDGVERASSQMPVGFGALYNSGQPLHVGHYAPYDGQTYGGGAEFPGVIDEVRIVNYARTAAQMSDTWFGTHTGGNVGASPNSSNGAAHQQANDGAGQVVASQPSVVAPQPSPTQSSSAQSPLMQLSAVNPREAVRDKASPQPHATLLRIEGEHLDKLAGALLARDGKPLSEANAIVKQADEHHAEILLSIAPTLKLGPALLVLNRPGTADASIQIQVTEPGEFAVEPDTAGLWPATRSSPSTPTMRAAACSRRPTRCIPLCRTPSMRWTASFKPSPQTRRASATATPPIPVTCPADRLTAPAPTAARSDTRPTMFTISWTGPSKCRRRPQTRASSRARCLMTRTRIC